MPSVRNDTTPNCIPRRNCYSEICFLALLFTWLIFGFGFELTAGSLSRANQHCALYFYMVLYTEYCCWGWVMDMSACWVLVTSCQSVDVLSVCMPVATYSSCSDICHHWVTHMLSGQQMQQMTCLLLIDMSAVWFWSALFSWYGGSCRIYCKHVK